MRMGMSLWGRRLLVCAGVLFPAGGVFASVTRKGFDETVRESLRELVDLSRSERKTAKASQLIEDLSQRVFSADPSAASRLKHLSLTAEREFRIERSWDEFSDFEAALGKSLSRPDRLGVAGRERLVSLLGASVFWHGVQHLYDGAEPRVRRAIAAGSELSDPLEKELRGWRAGCVFWEAGMDLNDHSGWFEWPRGFQCGGGLPDVYYCRHHFASELVLLAGQKLRRQGRLFMEVESALSAPARGGGYPYERDLDAYCAEYERADGGNALDRDASSSRWSLRQCLDKAAAAVLEPGWRSSLELCPAESKTGPDVRRAAWELKGWTRN